MEDIWAGHGASCGYDHRVSAYLCAWGRSHPAPKIGHLDRTLAWPLAPISLPLLGLAFLAHKRRISTTLLSGQRRTRRDVFLPEKRKVDSSILSLTTGQVSTEEMLTCKNEVRWLLQSRSLGDPSGPPVTGVRCSLLHGDCMTGVSNDLQFRRLLPPYRGSRES